MFYSASSTSSRVRKERYSRLDRAIARLLVGVLLLLTPVSAWAGDEFQDANNATYDNHVVTLDNTMVGETNFTIDTNRTVIEWNDFQQPANNTLDFNFSDPNSNSAVLNQIGASQASNVFGTLTSNGTVILANPFGVYIREGAVISVDNFVAIGANVSRRDFLDSESMAGTMVAQLTGAVWNGGLILAERNVGLFGRTVTNAGAIDSANGHVLAIGGESLIAYDWDALTSEFLAPKNFYGVLGRGRVENNGSIHARNAALFGGSILNTGDIAVDDGTLLMVAADAIWVSEFDNPVLFNIPTYDPSAHTTNASENAEVQYAIENHGRLDAGLGHVRLAASDPLGFAIRQGTGSIEAPATIVAQQITIEADDESLVRLSGEINADDLSDNGVGGTIDITGEMVILEGANIHASGTEGGGTIHVGGERQGSGELRRARLALVDADSQIRADAIRAGDGGEVIIFAEELTSVDGELSARGGDEGGNGGFVETSGLRNFRISRTPDVTAPQGQSGEWLIDPFDITIDDSLPSADTNLNNAIFAILSPNFDPASFDGILRSVDESVDGGPSTNFVSADLIENALSAGTSVTLSTQAFGIDPDIQAGNITIATDIIIDSANVIAGTTATLQLLAAADIIVNNDIMSAMMGTPSNLILTVQLRANDAGQVESNEAFSIDALQGQLVIEANIQTGGGDVILTGASVFQNSGTIDTDGGAVDIRTGSIDQFGNPALVRRQTLDDEFDGTGTPLPILQLSGRIDTSATNPSDTGGSVTLIANSLNVRTQSGAGGDEAVVAGQLDLIGTIESGGGDVALAGGFQSTFSGANSAGSVDITGEILSTGGDVTIEANHIDPDGETGSANVSFVDDPNRQGGVINIDVAIDDGDAMTDEGISTRGGALSIGIERTQSITLNGNFDTRLSSDPVASAIATENGLIQILALDLQSVDVGNDKFGQGEIIIGGTSATTISSSAVDIQSRSVSFSSDATGAVTLLAEGSSSATLPDLITPNAGETSAPDPLERNEIRIRGDRQITFNENTSLQAASIEIVAAAQPDQLNVAEQASVDRTRLVFGGSGGDDSSDGVRLRADTIRISVGNGTTHGSDLATQTELELQLLATNANYSGLQLRRTDMPTDMPGDGDSRPIDLQIQQDGDLTVTSVAAAMTLPAGELALGGAFGAFETPAIDVDGDIQIKLESSDGRLTIEDAAAFNGSQTSVVLNGGIYELPAAPGPGIVSSADDTIVLNNATPFGVESLTISSAGSLSVDAGLASAFSVPDELIFEAGRNTGSDNPEGRGTLTVEEGITITSRDRLALLAGGSGFGNLVFEDADAMVKTTLEANDLELRAGGGGNSQNSVVSDRSRITGLKTNVAIRDAGSAIFGDAASTATSFSYRQDAAIDGQADLPDLVDFGLTGEGFRTAGDVAYQVRSDESTIDLNDDDPTNLPNEGARFKNANLSLIGVDANDAPAIEVSSDFLFEGKRVEVGGIGNFVFTQELASAFNRNFADDEEELTIRAGAGGVGNLGFDSSVVVRAPRVNLIAGDGTPLDENGALVGQSFIDTTGAEFDLTVPVAVPGDPAISAILTMTGTSIITELDLPGLDQFTGGVLPDILALRSNLGRIDFQNFDATSLPLKLRSGAIGEAPGRLILEAFEVILTRTDGNDLDLTNIPGLNLRIRANDLTLIASDNDLASAGPATVHVETRMGDDPTGGTRTNASFDGESLLIEGLDSEETNVSIENLSAPSQDTGGTGFINLANSRGPTTISITQDNAITPATLFDRDAVAGHLTRTIEDDEDDNAIATLYSLASLLNSTTFNPDNVDGSTLLASGIFNEDDIPTPAPGADPFPTSSGVNFGDGTVARIFSFDSVIVSTGRSIVIRDDTHIMASDTISLESGLSLEVPTDLATPFGFINFEAADAMAPLSTLEASSISLTAGPQFKLEENNILPQIDFTGLLRADRAGDPVADLEGSSFSFTQSADIDMTAVPKGDFLRPILNRSGTNNWETLTVSSTQSNLNLDRISEIADVAINFIAGNLDIDAATIVNISPMDSFMDFTQGDIAFRSNDITFRSEVANNVIDLSIDNLTLVSTFVPDGAEAPDELGRLRNDPDADPDVALRPIVRIEQDADFDGSLLLSPGQYDVIGQFGVRSTRTDLSGLDIELKTLTLVGGTDADITFDSALRARVSSANLILDSAGDVNFALNGPTPGFEGFPEYADLQLTSLDVQSGPSSQINIQPFLNGAVPDDLTIETTGDQRFDGTLVLQDTLSTRGRDITFTGDVQQSSMFPANGLLVASSGKVEFEGEIGTSSVPLDRLVVTFDSRSEFGAPSLEFTGASDQTINVLNNILFLSYDFVDGDRTAEIENAIDLATTLPELASALSSLGLGRLTSAPYATIGKRGGDDGTERNIQFVSTGGNFVMSSGEKLSVAGDAIIEVDDGIAILGDVSSINLTVEADSIGIVRRADGQVFDRSGAVEQDGGTSISANTITFMDNATMGVTPTAFGAGTTIRFGLPNPFDAAGVPSEIVAFPLFALMPDGSSLIPSDFEFDATTGDLANQVVFLRPTGASRSDLSGAFGPVVEPTPETQIEEAPESPHPDRLLELEIDALETPHEVRLARLEGAAIIDDLGASPEDGVVSVTTARIDAEDAEAAIALYEELFGQEGEGAPTIRAILQDALDRYLENSRARRVVGFELRRFVKNRPSTLFEAYVTLESLDSLFRYHRRLGLSPGEFRGIQKDWLRQIHPDGITLDELSEAIHPSRYVRGSDILDIFGR